MGKIPRHRKTSKAFFRSKTSKVTPQKMITQKLKRTLKNMYNRKMKVILATSLFTIISTHGHENHKEYENLEVS